ncbi:unnamed protein product, partial [Allacma fusca]
RLLHKC